jgi:hypothetical protein
MRSQIFIGSSVEGLKYLELIKSHLEGVGDFTTWTTAFTQNRSALDSLIKKTKLSEFAIIVATNDDLTLKRNEIKSTPRDNIIFEFGLFTGASGIDNVFLLAEESADLPSDLEGIVVSKFSIDVTKYNSLQNVCESIGNHIKQIQATSQLGLLPSTALALGYYHSFIKKVCEQIDVNMTINSDLGKIRLKNFEFNVIVPNELDTAGVDDFRNQFNKQRGLGKAQTVVTNQVHRDYPFHFKIDPPDQSLSEEVEVKIFDVPTTLNTIVESIKLFMPSDKIGQNPDQDYLEKRELENFTKVLKHLVEKNSLTKKYVTIIGNVVI